MATKKAKKVTKKATKKNNNINIDFSDSINKIKETAINVNNQVFDTAGDVVEDVRENGEQIRDFAVTNAKKAYKVVAERVVETTEKVTERVNMKNIKTATNTVNEYTLKTADELVDGALASGQKWQGIANKAVKGSLKLAAKQQDIMFDTLETVKGQLTDSAKRLRKIFSNN